jgi:hypothetical protein
MDTILPIRGLPIYVFGEPIPENHKTVALLAANGVFVQTTITIEGKHILTVTGQVDKTEFPGAPMAHSGLALGIPKIPNSQYRRIMAFFKWAYEQYRSEAQGMIYVNPQEETWVMVPPPQTVSGGRVKYYPSGKMADGWYTAGTIHSHGGMSAFHSQTDQDDEEGAYGFHITTGAQGSIVASFVADDWRFKLNPRDLIEMDEDTFPETWKARVTQFTPPPVEGKWIQKSLGKWVYRPKKHANGNGNGKGKL